MDYQKLGNTGLEVSRIALGTMSFGQTGTGFNERGWTLDQAASTELVKTALDGGINFFDTCNSYSDGEGERILGHALNELADRDSVVIADRLFAPMKPGPNQFGLSRKTLIAQVDHSLQRLNTDYIDILEMGRFDYETPLEETLETLNDLVKAGKVRYLGASSLRAYQVMKILGLQQMHGWAKLAVLQDYYNVIYREEEREMIPLIESEGLSLTPWSPLARGQLARPWHQGNTTRVQTNTMGDQFTLSAQQDKPIIDRVEQIAQAHNTSMAQISMAWLLSKPYIAAPLAGETKINHLQEAIAAVDIKLSDDEIASLETPYTAHEEMQEPKFTSAMFAAMAEQMAAH